MVRFRRWAFLVVLTNLSSVSLALTDFFREPPIPGRAGDYSENYLYQIGTIARLRWTSTWINITMRLHQNDATGDYETILNNTRNPSGLDWRVATNKDVSVHRAFYLEIMDESRGNKGASFNSHYFNLTHSYVEPTSSIPPDPVTTASAFQESGISATSAPSATSDPTGARQTLSDPSRATTTTSSSSGSSSNSEHRYVVGLGVGVGLGIPLALCAGAAGMYFFLRRRMSPEPGAASPPLAWKSHHAAPVELAPQSPTYEMEGGNFKVVR